MANETYTMETPVFSPSNAANKAVTWHSIDTNVAVIDSTGRISPVNAGTTAITARATDGSGVVSTACMVTVVSHEIPVTFIGIREPEGVNNLIKMNQILYLESVVKPLDATFQEVIWKSSDESVISVMSNGRLIPKREGEAQISLETKRGSIKTTYNIKVIPEVLIETIQVELVSRNGNTYQYAAITGPGNATGKINWSTSDPQIATVNSHGLVTRLKDGNVTITARPETTIKSVRDFSGENGHEDESVLMEILEGFLLVILTVVTLGTIWLGAARIRMMY